MTRQHLQANRRDMKMALKLFVKMPTGINGLLYMKKVLGDRSLPAQPHPLAKKTISLLADAGEILRHQGKGI